MDLQVRTLFTHDDHSRLVHINEPGHAAVAPRFFLGRTRSGNIWRFRADVPEHIADEINSLCLNEPAGFVPGDTPRYIDDYVALLETHAAVSKRWTGPVYRFTEFPKASGPAIVVTENNRDALQGGFEEFANELQTSQPFVALLENGRPVCVCRSVRITPEAHEAGVETLAEFRGNGFAKVVTLAWAHLVHAVGAVPLFSTSWDNTASRALARKLGLELFGADFHIT